MKRWYNEFKGNVRIHDYFSLMINQFPILVVRKLDNPHSEIITYTPCYKW